MSNRETANILRDAARRIEKDIRHLSAGMGAPRYSCHAICDALGCRNWVERLDIHRKYVALFADTERLLTEMFFKEIEIAEDRKDARIVALCLAAAIAETGGL